MPAFSVALIELARIGATVGLVLTGHPWWALLIWLSYSLTSMAFWMTAAKPQAVAIPVLDLRQDVLISKLTNKDAN